MHFLSVKSQKVRDFRAAIYEEDFDVPAKYMSELDSYAEYKSFFEGHPDIEDIYKYSDCKYNNSGIEQVLMDDSESIISGGTIIDDDVYRAGHLLYCKRSKRKELRSWLYEDFGGFYAHVKRAIALEKNLVITAHWPHNNKIAANIKNHHRKLIGGKLPYFKQLEYQGTWELNNLQQEVFGYDIKKRFAEIEKLTMKENILPMGKYETLPVTAKYPHQPEKYGCVVELDIPKIDVKRLRKECEEVRENTPGYFAQRAGIYKIPPSEALNWLRFNGFSGETYDSTSLTVPGTADFTEVVTDYIKEVYAMVDANMFRQNYVIAKNGWSTRWHRDHEDPSIHGFRLMVPVDPVVMYFRSGTVELEPGKFYFVNNSLEHRGQLPEGFAERANLMAQMDNDKAILAGKVLL